jgi:hypothetical protein
MFELINDSKKSYIHRIIDFILPHIIGLVIILLVMLFINYFPFKTKFNFNNRTPDFTFNSFLILYSVFIIIKLLKSFRIKKFEIYYLNFDSDSFEIKFVDKNKEYEYKGHINYLEIKIIDNILDFRNPQNLEISYKSEFKIYQYNSRYWDYFKMKKVLENYNNACC